MPERILDDQFPVDGILKYLSRDSARPADRDVRRQNTHQVQPKVFRVSQGDRIDCPISSEERNQVSTRSSPHSASGLFDVGPSVDVVIAFRSARLTGTLR